jgi:hypothetical protein
MSMIGDTWDASSEDGHADFVTETTSVDSRGGAVFHPDAIISFKPVRPTDLIFLSPGRPFSNIFKTKYLQKTLTPRTRRLAPTGAVIAPAWM